jgi:hypothetical protein
MKQAISATMGLLEIQAILRAMGPTIQAISVEMGLLEILQVISVAMGPTMQGISVEMGQVAILLAILAAIRLTMQATSRGMGPTMHWGILVAMGLLAILQAISAATELTFPSSRAGLSKATEQLAMVTIMTIARSAAGPTAKEHFYARHIQCYRTYLRRVDSVYVERTPAVLKDTVEYLAFCCLNLSAPYRL